MTKLNKKLNYDFSGHKFPDIRLEGCSYIDYAPSQSDAVQPRGVASFFVVIDGKGSITGTDRRHTVTKESGVMITDAALRFKADSIEPATAAVISISGEDAHELVAVVEKKGQGAILDFGSDSRPADAALDIVSECSKDYRSDYGVMLAFYDFVNSLWECFSEKKIPSGNIYMTRAVEYIKQNYNKSISVAGIANMLGIERSYLSRLFKIYKNKSTQNYIIDYRMRRAKRMFEEEDMNVSQVCAAVGYTNIYCFSRIFKSRVGMPPKEYMEQCRRHGSRE